MTTTAEPRTSREAGPLRVRRAPRPLPAATRVARMARFETRFLFKQKVSLLSIVIAPLLVLAFPLLIRPEAPAGWVALLGPSTTLVLVMSVYLTTTSVVVSRREMQVFKRLRTSELAAPQMLAALSAPLAVIGVLQVLVVAGGYVLMGAPVPRAGELPPLLVGVVLASLTAIAAGTATGALTATSERVQFAVMPMVLVAAVCANLIFNPAMGEARGFLLLVPFAALANLVGRAFGLEASALAELPVPVPGVVVDLAALAVWAVVFALVARARWRWEPRG